VAIAVVSIEAAQAELEANIFACMRKHGVDRVAFMYCVDRFGLHRSFASVGSKSYGPLDGAFYNDLLEASEINANAIRCDVHLPIVSGVTEFSITGDRIDLNVRYCDYLTAIRGRVL